MRLKPHMRSVLFLAQLGSGATGGREKQGRVRVLGLGPLSRTIVRRFKSNP